MIRQADRNKFRFGAANTIIVEDKNTNISLAEGGDIFNEAATTALSIVKPQKILTNVLGERMYFYLSNK